MGAEGLGLAEVGHSIFCGLLRLWRCSAAKVFHDLYGEWEVWDDHFFFRNDVSVLVAVDDAGRDGIW